MRQNHDHLICNWGFYIQHSGNRITMKVNNLSSIRWIIEPILSLKWN